MSAPDRPTPTGGPWTRHGHDIPGVTVAGGHPPAVARCGGPALCRKCREDVELAHGGTSAAPDRPTREQVDATLRVAEDGRGDAHDARLLAAEVRAHRAELEGLDDDATVADVRQALRFALRTRGEALDELGVEQGMRTAAVDEVETLRRRLWSLLGADQLSDDDTVDRLRAALAAPQPAEPPAIRYADQPAEPPPPRGSGPMADCCGHHRERCQFGRSHVWASPWMENGRVLRSLDTAKCHGCGSVCTGEEGASAPPPAVPDGEDATCSCCNGDPLTVCAACEQHSCWAGRFMCDESRTAGTKQASPSPNREDDDRPVRWAWAAWLAESAEQADDLDNSERHGLRIAATHLLEDDIAARLNPGDFDPVADPAWALRFTARLWADVETGRAARRVSAPPDGEDVQHHPLTATALREAEQRWQNLPLDEKDRWAAEHDDPRCAFIAAALSTAATRPTGEGR